jgi:PBP1b-binding outer membrane lipoprotein LpoB
MRSFKWYAILLTIVLVMSGCCPANAITAAAAQTNSVEENAEEETAVPETEP